MIFENLTVLVDGQVTGYSRETSANASLSGNDVFLSGGVNRFMELDLGVHDSDGRIQLNYLYNGGDRVNLNGSSSGAVDGGEGLIMRFGGTGTNDALVANYQSNSSGNSDYVGTFTNSARQMVFDYEVVNNTMQISVIQDPIVLDLDGDGFHFKSLSEGIKFDLDSDGISETVSWVSEKDALLAIDFDGSGTIDNSQELVSEQMAGRSYGSAMEALQSLDGNSDGRLDANDAAFSDLLVWQDANSNGLSEDNELSTLIEAGIDHFDFVVQAPNAGDSSEILAIAQYELTDGITRDYAGIELASEAIEIDDFDLIVPQVEDGIV